MWDVQQAITVKYTFLFVDIKDDVFEIIRNNRNLIACVFPFSHLGMFFP